MWIDVHTHKVSKCADVIDILNVFPEDEIPKEGFFSAGVHPRYIDKDWTHQLLLVQEKSMHKKCLAIGECGLDKLSDVPMEIQTEVFVAQLRLAESIGKPVIIHCVKAYQELMKITQTEKISVPLIIHGYPKGVTLAQQLWQKGFYLSFGRLLLHSPKLQEAFISSPIDKVLLETDGADVNISEVYKKGEQLKNSCLKNKIKDNINRVFQLNLQPI